MKENILHNNKRLKNSKQTIIRKDAETAIFEIKVHGIKKEKHNLCQIMFHIIQIEIGMHMIFLIKTRNQCKI